MSSFWNFVFGAILIIVWIVAAGFVTQASVYLGPFVPSEGSGIPPGQTKSDDGIRTAYWYTFWAAFVTWGLIGIFIILIILSLIGVITLFGTGVGEAGVAAEAVESGVTLQSLGVTSQKVSGGISWFTIGFFIFALAVVITTGVLAALSAVQIVDTYSYSIGVPNVLVAYNDCKIAAIMCITAAGLLIIGIIIYFIVGWRQSQKAAQAIREQQEKIATQRSEVLAQLKSTLELRAAQKEALEAAAFKAQLAALGGLSNTPASTPVPDIAIKSKTD